MPPKIEPKERRRRAIPQRITTIRVDQRTPAQQRTIRSEMRRVERLTRETRNAAMNIVLRPLQENVNSLLRERDAQGFLQFARNGGEVRLARAQHRLEQERQRVITEYLTPLQNYRYFWEGQYHGNLPRGPPPPPPPGAGFINIRNRLLS